MDANIWTIYLWMLIFGLYVLINAYTRRLPAYISILKQAGRLVYARTSICADYY